MVQQNIIPMQLQIFPHSRKHNRGKCRNIGKAFVELGGDGIRNSIRDGRRQKKFAHYWLAYVIERQSQEDNVQTAVGNRKHLLRIWSNDDNAMLAQLIKN